MATTGPFPASLLQSRQLIGMVHLQALPGSPNHSLPVDDIIAHALREARMYRDAGLKTVLVENMHDVPYLRNPGPAVVSISSIIVREIRALGLHCGVQILAGANREALAVALAGGADFIRAEGFVFGHLADEGYIEACAGELLRYRHQLGAEHIAVFTDIKKKHSSHAITADVSIGETAKAAEYFLADGLIVTGSSTACAADLHDVRDVRETSPLPLLIGSGITAENLADYFPLANGFIVGSYVKEEGHWANPLCPRRLEHLVETFTRLPADS